MKCRLGKDKKRRKRLIPIPRFIRPRTVMKLRQPTLLFVLSLNRDREQSGSALARSLGIGKACVCFFLSLSRLGEISLLRFLIRAWSTCINTAALGGRRSFHLGNVFWFSVGWQSAFFLSSVSGLHISPHRITASKQATEHSIGLAFRLEGRVNGVGGHGGVPGWDMGGGG